MKQEPIRGIRSSARHSLQSIRNLIVREYVSGGNTQHHGARGPQQESKLIPHSESHSMTYPGSPSPPRAAAEKGQGDEVTARANEPRDKMFQMIQ